ncbi:hypothetical protein [Methylobacterium radiotolerans]|uniref:hypothetical protein n=1 Tax=Methylobacterium radiotolerans TaxID=31998 RepID=UPI0038D1A254
MPGSRPWLPAELVALDARHDPGPFVRFRLDDGEILTIDRSRYRLDGPTVQAIANTADVAGVEEGTGAFVKLRLDEEGMIREVADLDGRRRILLQRAA